MTSVVIGLFVVMLVMFVAASFLSRAGRIAPTLRPLYGKLVDVRVWGTAIPGYRVHSVRAIGAGLLILLDDGNGKLTLLKVAQPESARHDDRGVVIDDARYVQWRGARMPRIEGEPAVVIHDARQ